jgi:D-alanyl-D-alanine dipeptidase
MEFVVKRIIEVEGKDKTTRQVVLKNGDKDFEISVIVKGDSSFVNDWQMANSTHMVGGTLDITFTKKQNKLEVG